jgi:hypothetical protein
MFIDQLKSYNICTSNVSIVLGKDLIRNYWGIGMIYRGFDVTSIDMNEEIYTIENK